MVSDKKVNVIVGRFQPWTLGHIKGAEQVWEDYVIPTVFCIVETPESKVDSRHPFPSSIIIENSKKCKEPWFAGMFPVKNADIGKITAACRDNGYEPVMWTCGTDRYDAYSKQCSEKYLKMYNLTDDFKVNEIVRDDEDISATKVRRSLISNDFEKYKKMMPSWSWDDFDSYRPFVKESRLADFVSNHINEGFFKNIGGDIEKYKEWFDQVPVYFDQYDTQYDNKNIIKDRDALTITFPNKYKRNNKEKNVILNLEPYMDKLIKYDPRTTIIGFKTACWYIDRKKKGLPETRINHPEKRDAQIEKLGYDNFDKTINIKIYPCKYAHTHKDIINMREVNTVSPMGQILWLEQYTEDWPFSADSWTEIVNNL